MQRGSRKSRRANHCDVDANETAVTAAEEWLESELIEQRQTVRDGVMFVCMINVANSVMAARVHKMFTTSALLLNWDPVLTGSWQRETPRSTSLRPG